MNVRPFRGCLLVHRLDQEQTADHAIDAPGVSEDEPQKGTVLAVGRGNALNGGTRVALAIKVGDSILFGRQPRTEFHIDGQTVLVVREDQVLAVLGETLANGGRGAR
jgi:chaperonin GroES